MSTASAEPWIPVTMRYAALARVVPIATGLTVLAAGALQFTRWKAHHLASCRAECRGGGELTQCRCELPVGALSGWRHGLRLGAHCTHCCAAPTAALLVTGMMNIPVMLAMTAGITLERLAPDGWRIARIMGFVLIGAGLFLTGRAVGLV